MRRVLFIILMIPFLCNCSDDEYPQEIKGSGTPLSISSAGISISYDGNKTPTLRDAILPTPLTSGSIGVYLLADAGNGYSSRDNIKYNYSIPWVCDNPNNCIYLNNKTATVCAYYPYNASGIHLAPDGTWSNDPKAVKLTSQLYTADKDLCYDYVHPNNQNPLVSFSLKHAYSSITFNITNSTKSKGAISQITIEGTGLKKTNTLNISDGSYGTGNAGSVSLNPGIAPIAYGNTATIKTLLVPSTLDGEMTFSLNVDNTSKNVDLDLTTIEAGKNYQINLSLGLLPESNCYIVKPGNTLYIPVSRANSGWTTANLGTAIAPGETWTAGLLWTDNPNKLSPSGSIESISSSTTGGYIRVKAGTSEGNSVIYAKNSSNKIVWSWHIWVTNYDPDNKSNGTIYSYNGKTFMDRNLGATSSTPDNLSSQGLIYQWGRKDPFPASSSLSGVTNPTIYDSDGYLVSMSTQPAIDLNSSINNPLTFYTGTPDNNYDWYSSSDNHDDALWGSAKANKLKAKTIYDPCPVGWRVPAFSVKRNKSVSPWDGIGFTSSSYGFKASQDYYPAAGYRSDYSGKLNAVGSYGEYWNATATGYNAYGLELYRYNDWFNGWTVDTNPYLEDTRASGKSVRCVKE